MKLYSMRDYVQRNAARFAENLTFGGHAVFRMNQKELTETQAVDAVRYGKIVDVRPNERAKGVYRFKFVHDGIAVVIELPMPTKVLAANVVTVFRIGGEFRI